MGTAQHHIGLFNVTAANGRDVGTQGHTCTGDNDAACFFVSSIDSSVIVLIFILVYFAKVDK
ncbi:MAG: hypothetical protein ACI8R9_000839 [Paraglaciecola sp.]